MVNVYGNSCPSLATVKRWHTEFKRGRESLDDDPKSGRPPTSINDKNIDAVHDLIMADRRITIDKIADILVISHGSVVSIIHDELDMRKVCAQWVPKLLRRGQMNTRVALAKLFLERFNTIWDQVRPRLVTGDETWVHHSERDSRQSGMEWRKKGEKGPKKPKIKSKPGKIMATFFWDFRGVIMVDYLPRGHTMTGEYYAGLMWKLRDQIKEKRRGMLAKGVLLLHDNARVHTCKTSKDTIMTCGYELIPHAPYSPDLAPSDYYLFPNLKNDKRSIEFESDNEVQEWVKRWIGSKSEDFFAKGIDGLLPRLEECIALRGNYLEK